MENLIQALWLISLQAAVLAGVVWVVTWLARRSPASWRHALWLIVLVKFFVPPVAIIPHQWAFWVKESPAPVVASFAQPMADDVVPMAVPRSTPAATAYVPALPDVPETVAEPVSRTVDWRQVAFGFWLLGVVVMSGVLVRRCGRVVAVRKRARQSGEAWAGLLAEAGTRLGVRRLPEVMLSDDVSGPLLVGLFRPVILMPSRIRETCSEPDLLAILSHELAHAKRWDMAIGALQQLAQALFFFHPAVWLTGHELRQERELACDEMVLSRTGIPREQYAAGFISALKLTNGATAQPTAMAMAEPFDLGKRRLEHIMHGMVRRMSVRWITAILIMAAIGLPTIAGIGQAAAKALGLPAPIAFGTAPRPVSAPSVTIPTLDLPALPMNMQFPTAHWGNVTMPPLPLASVPGLGRLASATSANPPAEKTSTVAADAATTTAPSSGVGIGVSFHVKFSSPKRGAVYGVESEMEGNTVVREGSSSEFGGGSADKPSSVAPFICRYRVWLENGRMRVAGTVDYVRDDYLIRNAQFSAVLEPGMDKKLPAILAPSTKDKTHTAIQITVSAMPRTSGYRAVIALKHTAPSQMKGFFERQAYMAYTGSPRVVHFQELARLPQGVMSLTPDDAAGTLTAWGSKKGLEALRQLVSKLDVAPKQIVLRVSLEITPPGKPKYLLLTPIVSTMDRMQCGIGISNQVPSEADWAKIAKGGVPENFLDVTPVFTKDGRIELSGRLNFQEEGYRIQEKKFSALLTPGKPWKHLPMVASSTKDKTKAIVDLTITAEIVDGSGGLNREPPPSAPAPLAVTKGAGAEYGKVITVKRARPAIRVTADGNLPAVGERLSYVSENWKKALEEAKSRRNLARSTNPFSNRQTATIALHYYSAISVMLMLGLQEHQVPNSAGSTPVWYADSENRRPPLVPDGVDYILPYQEGRMLLVGGETKAIKRFEKVIRKLDVKHKEVTIKLEIYKETAPGSSRGLDSAKDSGSAVPTIGGGWCTLMTQDTRKAIDFAVQAGDIRPFNAPIVTTVSGVAAWFGVDDDNIPKVTPRVNGDGTVTSFVEFQGSSSLIGGNPHIKLPYSLLLAKPVGGREAVYAVVSIVRVDVGSSSPTAGNNRL